MRLAALCLFALTATAVAEPPAKISPAIQKLIDQLGSEDFGTRKAAETKLTEAGEDALGALREIARTHPDVDVRLRAPVIAAALEKASAVEVSKFEGHTDGVLVLAVSPDGRRLASASAQSGSEQVVRVWRWRQARSSSSSRATPEAPWAAPGRRTARAS